MEIGRADNVNFGSRNATGVKNFGFESGTMFLVARVPATADDASAPMLLVNGKRGNKTVAAKRNRDENTAL